MTWAVDFSRPAQAEYYFFGWNLNCLRDIVEHTRQRSLDFSSSCHTQACIHQSHNPSSVECTHRRSRMCFASKKNTKQTARKQYLWSVRIEIPCAHAIETTADKSCHDGQPNPTGWIHWWPAAVKLYPPIFTVQQTITCTTFHVNYLAYTQTWVSHTPSKNTYVPGIPLARYPTRLKGSAMLYYVSEGVWEVWNGVT